MSEKVEPKQGIRSQDIDPIAFGDEKVLGLDPAIHWIEWNNQREQFPEIVGEITKHWNDADWLIKLVARIGYSADVYDPVKNPKGIFLNAPSKRGQSVGGLSQIRYFLLRAAGVKTELIRTMFGTDEYQSQLSKSNTKRSVGVAVLAMNHFKEINTRRKNLYAKKP